MSALLRILPTEWGQSGHSRSVQIYDQCTTQNIIIVSWLSGNVFVSGAGDLRFKSWVGQLGQSYQRLATAATFLRKLLCFQGAMTWRWAPQTCYTLRRNTASIIKMFDFDSYS